MPRFGLSIILRVVTHNNERKTQIAGAREADYSRSSSASLTERMVEFGAGT
jgi:hypothetical protein